MVSNARSLLKGIVKYKLYCKWQPLRLSHDYIKVPYNNNNNNNNNNIDNNNNNNDNNNNNNNKK